MCERVEGDRTDVPRGVSEHAPWCTDHRGEACNSDTLSVAGVNVGTWLSLWISDDDLPRGTVPIPAYMGLVHKEEPASDIYLDSKGLRALATAATKLADALDS